MQHIRFSSLIVMNILGSDLHRNRSANMLTRAINTSAAAEAFKVSQTQLLKLDPDVLYPTADQ